MFRTSHNPHRLQHTTQQRYKYVIISSSHLPRSRALWERSSWSNSCWRGNSTARKFLSSSVKQYITWHCGNNKIVWYSWQSLWRKTVKSKERQAGGRSLFPMLLRVGRPQDVWDYALAREMAPGMTGLRNKIAIFDSPLHKPARKRKAFWAAPELNHLNLQKTTTKLVRLLKTVQFP